MKPTPQAGDGEEDVLLRKGISGTHPVDQVWGTLRLDRPVDDALDEMRGISAEERVMIGPTSSARSKTLGEQFESLLESIQTPEARKGIDAAFNATLRSSAGRPPRRRFGGADYLVHHDQRARGPDADPP